MTPANLKIAYIGGGSRQWARKLMMDLALCPHLSGEVLLYDIDMEASTLNEELGNWLQLQAGVLSYWQYRAVQTLPEALQGADFVVISIQPGSLEVMEEEISTAERYGLYYPVGDTTGAAGLVRGLRSVGMFAEFAEAIWKFCPKAWVLNYTNPMAICTRTLTVVQPGLKVFGCCHEVFATQLSLARLAGESLGVEAPPRSEIHVNVLGINHFTWINQATWQGHDLLSLLKDTISRPGVLRPYTQEEVEGWNDWFHCEDLVKFTLFKHFGILPAAGDRHLVEFLPGFIHSPDILFRWGIIRTPVSWRIRRWNEAPQKTRELLDGQTPLVLESSGEEGIDILQALLGSGDLITNVNMENRGQISNLPLGCVVETNASISRDQICPLNAGALPIGVASLSGRHVANQEMIIEAALRKDKEVAFQAVFNDPSSDLPIDISWEMFNLLLKASREFLPGWNLD